MITCLYLAMDHPQLEYRPSHMRQWHLWFAAALRSCHQCYKSTGESSGWQNRRWRSRPAPKSCTWRKRFRCQEMRQFEGFNVSKLIPKHHHISENQVIGSLALSLPLWWYTNKNGVAKIPKCLHKFLGIGIVHHPIEGGVHENLRRGSDSESAARHLKSRFSAWCTQMETSSMTLNSPASALSLTVSGFVFLYVLQTVGACEQQGS